MGSLFSIVIPTFNSKTYAPECVASALAQSYSNIEVIIDDNTSRDGTVARLRSDFGNDSRLRIFENQEDLNIPNGWNRAMSHAKGDYLLLLHSDNLLHPDYVDVVVQKMHACDAKVAYTDCKYFEGETPDGLFDKRPSEVIHDQLGRGPGAVAYTFRFQRMIPTSGLTIHRDCFERRRPYDPQYRWDPDMEQMAWLAHEFGVLHVRFSLAAIRTHPGQAASWRDPSFSEQYRNLLLLEHQRGLTEKHHFLLDWAASNEYITNRLAETGAPAKGMIVYSFRWFVAECGVLFHFGVQFLRKQKLQFSALFRWARACVQNAFRWQKAR